MDFSKILTITVIAFAIVGVGLFVWNQVNQSELNYENNLHYSLTKTALNYDFSCDQEVYSLNMALTNSGTKLVDDFSVSVTNALCEGAVPLLPSTLEPGQQLDMDIYTTTLNGTITITGNNTVLLIPF